MTDEELIEELSEMGRHPCRAHLPMGERLRQASDRIETLTAENERLREALRVLRDLPIVENDNANTLHLDGVAHTGPVVDWLFHFVRKIKKVSDAALEKKP
jgi:hypothetical protein